MRVVLDTKIIVSALIARAGKPAAIKAKTTFKTKTTFKNQIIQ
jgi:predicted nucleic acid-binding protein